MPVMQTPATMRHACPRVHRPPVARWVSGVDAVPVPLVEPVDPAVPAMVSPAALPLASPLPLRVSPSDRVALPSALLIFVRAREVEGFAANV